MDHLSQEWEKLQGPTITHRNTSLAPVLGAAVIVVVSVNSAIDLWQKSNQDIQRRDRL